MLPPLDKLVRLLLLQVRRHRFYTHSTAQALYRSQQTVWWHYRQSATWPIFHNFTYELLLPCLPLKPPATTCSCPAIRFVWSMERQSTGIRADSITLSTCAANGTNFVCTSALWLFLWWLYSHLLIYQQLTNADIKTFLTQRFVCCNWIFLLVSVFWSDSRCCQ